MRARPLAALLLVPALACSAESDPVGEQYTLSFPSTAAAVATESVQLLVFDVPPGTSRANLCPNLLQKRKSAQPLGKALVEGPPVSPCNASKQPVTIPFGEHALFAIARKEGKDYLLGCTLQTIAVGDPPAAVYLTPVTAQVITPTTKCPQLSAFCSRTCPN